MSENTDDGPTYTVTLNNKQYALNDPFRTSIEERAEREYAGNGMLSYWWKVADPEQYADGAWEQTVHDVGDPVLVIETQGTKVPWENLDQLEVEVDFLDFFTLSKDTDEESAANHSNGMKSVEPERDDNDEIVEGRTHFPHIPRGYEDMPYPESDRMDKIPPKVERAGDGPELVQWVPNHPDVTHSWATGEAMIPVASRVEWNVQKRADQPRIFERKRHSHDHWESMLQMHGCEVIKRITPEQSVPSRNVDTRSDEQRYREGIAGGNNWHV
jgi:hypothetical protein